MWIGRVEWRYSHSSVLGFRGDNAYVGLGSHLLGVLLGPLYAWYSGIWRTGVLSRLVQDPLTRRLFLHFLLGQCRCLW